MQPRVCIAFVIPQHCLCNLELRSPRLLSHNSQHVALIQKGADVQRLAACHPPLRAPHCHARHNITRWHLMMGICLGMAPNCGCRRNKKAPAASHPLPVSRFLSVVPSCEARSAVPWVVPRTAPKHCPPLSSVATCRSSSAYYLYSLPLTNSTEALLARLSAQPVCWPRFLYRGECMLCPVLSLAA